MTAQPTGVYATRTSTVAVGGQPTTIIYGPILGALIVNPYDAADQGLAVAEPLFVNVIGSAAASFTGTTVAIQPGQSYTVPAQTTDVSVNAATSGHRFSAITFQPQGPMTSAQVVGLTNPCLQDIIPSYLYQQYANDDDLQAFVSAYNTIAQQYLTWLNDTPLPVYTSPAINGALLDWVGAGLYGVPRPVLSAGNVRTLGPFDTYQFNEMPYAARRTIGPAVYTPVSDDIYKRVLTWKLYKGDGKQINIRWLKRRVLRFLLGGDGTDPDVADTQQVSVTFGGNIITITVVETTLINTAPGPLLNSQVFNGMGFNLADQEIVVEQSVTDHLRDNQVNINFLSQRVTSMTGASFNAFGGNEVPFNDFVPTEFEHFSPLPNIQTFKQAVDQGVLDMPFQFRVVVNIR